LKPSMTVVRDLMLRWSCSIRLLQQFGKIADLLAERARPLGRLNHNPGHIGTELRGRGLVRHPIFQHTLLEWIAFRLGRLRFSHARTGLPVPILGDRLHGYVGSTTHSECQRTALPRRHHTIIKRTTLYVRTN
jgi:hypothetical protein